MSDLATSKASPIADAKTRLRRIVLTRRQAFDAAQSAAAATALRDAGLERILRAPGAVVSGYWPSRGEPDVRPLLTALNEAGRRIVLPVMAGRTDPLSFRLWEPGDALVEGPFKIQEPADNRETLDPDILLVPLVAFDAEGYRIGYGGGYYDRTIAARGDMANIVTIGVAYACQEVVRVPRESHDRRMDWILTPDGVRQARA